ncbi:uncharacterized protein Tco025E_09477, partial [Trypanosoma conorhini]
DECGCVDSCVCAHFFCLPLPLSSSFWLVVGVQPQRKPTTTAKEGTHVSNAWETRGRSLRCCGGALHLLRRRVGVGGGWGPPAALGSPQRGAEGRRRHRRGHSEPLTARWRECASLCSTRSGATSWGFLRLKGGKWRCGRRWNGATHPNAVGGVHGAGDNSSTAGQRGAASCTASRPDGTRLRGRLAVPADGGREHCRLLRSPCGGGGCGGLSRAVGMGRVAPKDQNCLE